MPAAFEAFFAAVRPGPLGQRLCLWHAPPDGRAPHGLIVFVHAFAEEMNKSRRMAALQSRAFAAAGHAVLQIDLLGCGDSAGDFGDASWQAWVDDVVDAVGLAFERHAQAWPGAARPELWLWGHRAGCLLACAAAARLKAPCNFLFWQPTPNGKTVLQQFLRLEAAGALMGKPGAAGKPTARAVLDGGGTAELAGYRISAALARGLEEARLRPTPPHGGARVEWIDVMPQPPESPPPVAQQGIAAWAEAGHAVHYGCVAGPAFWQSTEIEEAPLLLAASLARLAPGAATPAGQPAPAMASTA